MRVRLITIVAIAVVCSRCGDASEPTVRPDEPPLVVSALERLLNDGERRYDTDVQMLVTEFRSPGYHTRIASGTLVHPTRESLIYALALLQRDAAGDTDRAAAIIRRVIGLQDTDAASKTFGVWPWLLEEPLAKMKSPDLNWADFCGSQLAHMLVERSEQLPVKLRASMRASLRRAVTAIRNRNVGPGYTNIAVLGGSVCVISGELFGDADSLQYGRKRLQGVVEHVERHGGFREYNSPPYSKVVIGESERLLHLARDPASRTAAESLRQTCWQAIAASFHPATHQWAGPHSRTSSIRLEPSTVEFLSERTGGSIKTHPTMVADARPSRYATVPPLPCPAKWQSRFEKAAERPEEIRRTFARNKSGAATIIGTTWHAADACLGSVNRSGLWTQRKPLTAYWKTDDDPAVAFRARFLHDGRDFASMGIRTAQRGPQVVCWFHTMKKRGDWHRSLDRPADGLFHATDLRIRFELLGEAATARPLGKGRYELAAGRRRIVLHTLPGRFAGRDVVWGIGEDGQSLEGVCHSGERRSFDFNRDLDVRLCAGVELLGQNDPPTVASPQFIDELSGTIGATWHVSDSNVLSVKAPGE